MSKEYRSVKENFSIESCKTILKSDLGPEMHLSPEWSRPRAKVVAAPLGPAFAIYAKK